MRKNILFLFLLGAFAILLVMTFQINTGPLSFAEKQPGGKLPVTKQSQFSNISGGDIERLNLQKDLGEEIAALGATDHVSLYYKNLTGGYEVKINADESWIPASMVKAYVVVEAYRQKRLKIINFDSRVTIKDQNVVPTELESSSYQPLRAGVRATIKELIDAMIAQSDNTAYNTLLDVLDRRNISSTLRSLGLDNTVVGEKLSLSDDQYAQDTLVLGRQPNRTTAADFGYLFSLLYDGKIEDSNEILSIFKRQIINDMIPALIPKNVVVAHKTGTWGPYHHDGGIVYKPDDPFIVVIFTDKDDSAIVAKLAKISYYKTRDILGVTVTRWSAWMFELLDKGFQFLQR